MKENMKEINKVTWRSPSNIALVKYWGKKDGTQIPANPSISLTLEHCYSETSLSLVEKERKGKELEMRFYFDGKENMAFRLRMLKFFDLIAKDFPLLRQYGLLIHSTNSFPHSSGIASSASAMSALALCLCDLQEQLNGNKKVTENGFFNKASYYSRLGSGSASRSVYGYAAEWGKAKGIKESSDQHAIPFEKGLHKVFKNYQDTILIASSAEKKVSSRVGHSLMKTNPFAKTRYEQANKNLSDIVKALKTGDIEKFGTIVEEEATTLHALMLCSNPSFILMAPSTLAMIEKVKHFRETEKLPVYFSLDAGPNIHLLYPQNIKRKVDDFIFEDLEKHCEQGKMIHDNTGKGPFRVK